MADIDLLPPNQKVLAHNAMLSMGKDMIGDGPAQFAVLALAVRLAEAGIEPTEEFKLAAMMCLKRAVESGQMPRPNRRGRPSKKHDASSFEIAVIYWKEFYERGEAGANKRATQDAKVKYEAQVTNAVKLHGPIARRAALWELCFDNETGPNIAFCRELEKLDHEIAAGKHVRTRPKGGSTCDWRWLTK